MTDRYTWSVDTRGRRSGRSAERRTWSASRAAPPETAPPGTPPAGGLPAGPVGGAAPAGAGAVVPPGPADLWQPVGPTTTVRGLVDSDVRVAGRVNAIAVSDDGARAYAVSALGGVWYTEDAGARWEPVGAWRTTSDQGTLAASSNTLTGGAVQVIFGADAGSDEVWVGTGEPLARGQRDAGVVGNYGGVGVLHALHPVTTVRAAPYGDPWGPAQAVRREQSGADPLYLGLRGQGFFAFAADPADPHRLLAATTRGLHGHDPAAAAGTDPWSLVTVPAWDALAADLSQRATVTDVAWLPAGSQAARRYACLVDATVGATGLWAATGTGAFARVPLPGLPAATSRLTIAAHRNHPDVLYVLGTGPRLWRVDASTEPPTSTAVAHLPGELFGKPPADQSHYDCAAAIDPADASTVMVGGAAVASPVDAVGSGSSPSYAAALYRLTVTASGTGFRTDYVSGDASDRTWVGSEVHPDVHVITWLVTPSGPHVWVGCDGGAFRSSLGGALGTFVGRGTGMAVSEPGFVAIHPTSPGVLLAGMQDNGPQLQIGAGVWRQAVRAGDGGGVAFDPGEPGRFVAQATNSTWMDDTNDTLTPTFRYAQGPGSAFDVEDRNALFYCAPAVVRTPDPAAETRLAVATDRVWFTNRWGRSHWDGAFYRRSWVTLPSGTDPRAGDASGGAALTHDRLDPGPVPWGTTAAVPGVRQLRWRDTERLWVLTRGRLHQLTHPTAAGAWALTVVASRVALPPGVPPAVVPPPSVTAGLPGFGEYNDIAVHDVTVGSFYLATSHPLEPLWWWDGKTTCLPTTLGVLPDGTRSPAYAVVVDPADTTAVYVGTTSGVWQGRFTPGVGPTDPTWAWRRYGNGLPEAAAQDLAIGVWPRPGGGPDLRLLRVALQARGTFEVDLGAPCAPLTLLRVHPHDTRRLLPTPLEDPLFVPGSPRRSWALDWAGERNRDHRTGGGLPSAHPDGTPVGSFTWHASPDLRLRPTPVALAPAAPAVPVPPGLPWTSQPNDRFWLWTVQTAVHALSAAAFPAAPLVVPDGRWTAWWVRRLRAVRTAMGLPNPGPATRGTVDLALWNDARVQAALWSVPWADGGPTEADLIERVVGMATPRTGPPSAAAQLAASSAASARPWQVDVCVHHRGQDPAAAADVAVVLLRATLPAAATDWAAVVAPTIAGLPAALDALPADTSAGPSPNALPGYLPPAGWTFVDPARPARRPTRDAAAASPAVVTFDADLTADAVGTDLVLLALVHHRAEPVTIAAAGLRDVVLGSTHAAARTVRIRS